MRTSIGLLIALLAVTTARAADTVCSIHPPKDTTDKQYAGLAKISQADAEKKALARSKSPAKVLGSALQVEDNCLLWVIIVKESTKSGMKSLRLDAGTGRVLETKHESGK